VDGLRECGDGQRPGGQDQLQPPAREDRGENLPRDSGIARDRDGRDHHGPAVPDHIARMLREDSHSRAVYIEIDLFAMLS